MEASVPGLNNTMAAATAIESHENKQDLTEREQEERTRLISSITQLQDTLSAISDRISSEEKANTSMLSENQKLIDLIESRKGSTGLQGNNDNNNNEILQHGSGTRTTESRVRHRRKSSEII